MEQVKKERFNKDVAAVTNVHDITLPRAQTEKFFGDRPVLQVECSYVDAALNVRGKNLVLVDVRSPLAFWRGHLPTAINIPSNQSLAGALSGVPKAGGIVIYGTGADYDDALKIASIIASADRQIRILRGGASRWFDLGLDVVRPRQDADRIAAF